MQNFQLVKEMDQLLQFNVSLYEEYPTGDSFLHKLLDMCMYRLRLYSILKNHENVTLEMMKKKLENNPLGHLLEIEETAEVVKAREIDYISHWALKILYCNTHPDFFIKCETRWVHLRYNNMPYHQRLEFLKKCDFNAPLVSLDDCEKFQLRDYKWYSIDFKEICVLVRRRLYPMSLGYVFIPEHKLGFWVAEKLEAQLKRDLPSCRRKLPQAAAHLKTLTEVLVLVEPFEARVSTDLTLDTLDRNSKYFPLCMRVQHETLREKHYLKYHSRKQYGLFLKGLGLSLDDALKLWKHEFLKTITEKAFNREFPYYFNHQYGLKGSMIDYPAESCDRILEETPSSNQIHGCPFKHWGPDSLSQRLRKEGVSEICITQILVLKCEEQYKKCCTVYLENMTGSRIDDIITHPVTYYEKSCGSCRGDGLPDIEDLFISEPLEH